MIKVVKGNVVLRVEDDMLDYYVDRGFTAKSLDGTVLKKAIPTDADSLRKAYIESQKEIKALKEEIDALKQEIASSKSKTDKSLAVDSIAEDTAKTTVSEEKPKRTRRKSAEITEE